MESNRAIILAALIGLVGTIGTAVIANWEVIFGAHKDELVHKDEQVKEKAAHIEQKAKFIGNWIKHSGDLSGIHRIEIRRQTSYVTLEPFGHPQKPDGTIDQGSEFSWGIIFEPIVELDDGILDVEFTHPSSVTKIKFSMAGIRMLKAYARISRSATIPDRIETAIFRK